MPITRLAEQGAELPQADEKHTIIRGEKPKPPVKSGCGKLKARWSGVGRLTPLGRWSISDRRSAAEIFAPMFATPEACVNFWKGAMAFIAVWKFIVVQ
jgi:hypothetical protein